MDNSNNHVRMAPAAVASLCTRKLLVMDKEHEERVAKYAREYERHLYPRVWDNFWHGKPQNEEAAARRWARANLLPFYNYQQEDVEELHATATSQGDWMYLSVETYRDLTS
jgi:hypothetical protein